MSDDGFHKLKAALPFHRGVRFKDSPELREEFPWFDVLIVIVWTIVLAMALTRLVST